MRFQPTITALLATGALCAAFGLGAIAEQDAKSDLAAWSRAKTPVDPTSTVVKTTTETIDAETGFAENAFPPTIPDQEWHREAWTRTDCMTCHETGVQEAPILRHTSGLPALAIQAKCRTCHVLVPGKTEARPASARTPEVNDEFAADAFPPMMPNTKDHRGAWGKNDCMICHETGSKVAPPVDHGPRIPRLALISKCRTCHVQVRSNETSPWDW